MTLLSCEKTFVVNDLNHKSHLVLNSYFSPDTFLSIHLSSSKNPYIKNDSLSLEEAHIKLIYNNEVFTNFARKEKGNYYIKLPLEKDNKYSIEVTCHNYKTITANSYIPSDIKISKFLKKIIKNNENEENVEIKLLLNAKDNSYVIIRHIVLKTVLINKDTITFRDTAWIQPNSAQFESVLPSYAPAKLLFANIKKGEIELSFLSYDGFDKNNIVIIKGISIIELFSSSNDYYKYQKDLELYNWNNTNINTSIINPTGIYNNINNGFGIFAGFNKTILLDTFK